MKLYWRHLLAVVGILILGFTALSDAQWDRGIVDLATEVVGTLPVGNGGTGIVTGTSGGVLGFTATNVMASSAVLGANQIVLGGGAGATPSALAAGTTGTILQGATGASPAWTATPTVTSVLHTGTVLASLGTPANGTLMYCSNCDPTATLLTCTAVGGQTGAFAHRVNGAWKCVG